MTRGEREDEEGGAVTQASAGRPEARHWILPSYFFTTKDTDSVSIVIVCHD